MRIISAIVPLLNEEKNIPLMYKQLKAVAEKLQKRFALEFIFVNDGSTDTSQAVIESLAKKDKRVKFIQFTRNFDKETATSAGLEHAKGEAAIILDADLQHPPQLIPKFIKAWQDGAYVVIGVRKKNRRYNPVRKLLTKSYYLFMDKIADTKIVPNATDYRLLDRKVIDEFNRFTERNRITRGLIDWLGFTTDYIYFDVAPRAHGTPSYNGYDIHRLLAVSHHKASSSTLQYLLPRVCIQ